MRETSRRAAGDTGRSGRARCSPAPSCRRRESPGPSRRGAGGGSHPFLAPCAFALPLRLPFLLLLLWRSRDQDAVGKTFYSMNSDETESSLLIRKIVSASK